MSFLVYKISDGINTYIGSTTRTIPVRKAQHHINFKDENIKWKLYKYWRSIGWENMHFTIIMDGLNDKKELKELEQETIKSIPKEVCLNTIKAFCPDYEATRSINSEMGEIDKIEMKRKNRRDHYARKKLDSEWVEKVREKNNARMKIKRSDPLYKEKDKQRRTTKITCSCGTVITVDAKTKHERTKKHLALLSLNSI